MSGTSDVLTLGLGAFSNIHKMVTRGLCTGVGPNSVTEFTVVRGGDTEYHPIKGGDTEYHLTEGGDAEYHVVEGAK